MTTVNGTVAQEEVRVGSKERPYQLDTRQATALTLGACTADVGIGGNLAIWSSVFVRDFGDRVIETILLSVQAVDGALERYVLVRPDKVATWPPGRRVEGTDALTVFFGSRIQTAATQFLESRGKEIKVAGKDFSPFSTVLHGGGWCLRNGLETVTSLVTVEEIMAAARQSDPDATTDKVVGSVFSQMRQLAPHMEWYL